MIEPLGFALKLEPATVADAEAITALRNGVADDLTTRHGKGWWSGQCTSRGILFDLRHGNLLIARRGGRIISTLNLVTRKPWSIDRSYFTPVDRPLYLVSMAVAPELQGRGVGRACFDEARLFARRYPAGAIKLDAFEHAAGAGEFYRKCGCRETGRAKYRNVPLINFEMLVD